MCILYRKKILVFLIVCPVFWGKILYAEGRTAVVGGKAGWSSLSVMDGITTGKGRFGYTCLQLATKTPVVSDDTDLLLHFEDSAMSDSADRYDIVDNSFIRTDKCIRGRYSALSIGTGGGMRLHGKPGSMFGTEGRVSSFSIEFWIAPSIAENGEIIFSWRSSRNVSGYPLYQMITASFFNSHLVWKFSNVFDGYTKADGEIELSGTKTIIPDKWSCHKISYDEDSGLMEYRVDGRLESILYITSSGHERGTVYPPMLGVPADIELCPQYTGRLDDFCIVEKDSSNISSADLGEGFHNDTYKIAGGRFETRPVGTKVGSILNSVSAVMNIPPQTDVRLYVRGGDNYFGWTETDPEWIPVEDGKPIKSVSGLYFQLAADLFPDGAGQKTPSVTEISLNYTEQQSPLPPFTVKAVAGIDSVSLSWNYSVDNTTGGYYVYYGERPGEYLGRIAVEGPSPINVGNTNSFTLTGLKNGTIYYFAVSSWSRFDSRINGQLSQEVYARPFGR